jgi:hypothetical protein
MVQTCQNTRQVNDSRPICHYGYLPGTTKLMCVTNQALVDSPHRLFSSGLASHTPSVPEKGRPQIPPAPFCPTEDPDNRQLEILAPCNLLKVK